MRLELPLPASAQKQILLFGQNDANLRLLRAEYNLKIVPRGETLILDGTEEKVLAVQKIFELLLNEISGETTESAINRRLAIALECQQEDASGGIRTERGRIEPKTPGQRAYVQAVRNHHLTFALGPAGTGKTFLAVACAVECLRRGEVERLVLTRPAVEAGENLGFLPGDMREKVDPYLRPVYDALGEMAGARQLANYIDSGVIEVAPLAFMRGRTLNRAFVILDEAQNTTPVQMKMFLTRLGERSRCVVNGDATQIDLPDPERCGLTHAVGLLRGLQGVSVVEMQKADIVRHPLVAAIVHAYEMEGRGV